MNAIRPLERFPIISTHSIDEAEDVLSRSVTDTHITRVRDRSRFELQMNGTNLGHASLLYNRMGTGISKDVRLHNDSVLFVYGGNAPVTLVFDRESVVLSPRKGAVVLPATIKRIERSAGSEAFALRLPLSGLLHHFEKLTAQTLHGSLTFEHGADLTHGPGAMLHQVLNSFFYELDHNVELLNNPRICKYYDNMLFTAVLSLPHDQTEKLYEDHGDKIVPGLVRRTEEYMRAYLKEPISITDLLKISGSSRRTLFSAFRKTRNYTPMEFLAEQRLQSARSRLLKPHADDTITSIAMDCGFFHQGRFSQLYKNRFGERPSDTLCRTK